MNEVKDQVSSGEDVTPDNRPPDAGRHYARTSRISNPIDMSLPTNGLPRHVAGGFSGVAADLERRSRDWTMMVRLLDQQRMQLETSEGERQRLYAELESILPVVQSSSANLTDTVERTKAGDVSANLSALFVENLAALDKLENVAKALTANLLWTRSSWEQYARSVIGAEKMRSELRG